MLQLQLPLREFLHDVSDLSDPFWQSLPGTMKCEGKDFGLCFMSRQRDQNGITAGLAHPPQTSTAVQSADLFCSS